MVFAGIFLASILIIGIGIILGQGLLRVIPQRYIRYFSSGLFIIFGIMFLSTALLGINII